METYVKPPRTGMEAFELMPEGTLCELINDNLVMSPAPTPGHQRFSKQLFKAIERLVEANDLGEVLYSLVDVYLNERNVYQPDIIFVSKEQTTIIDWNKGIMGAPDLVIEILSKGNKNYDLNKKKAVYEAEGVKEYWVVNYKTKWCEGFFLENGAYQSLGEGNGKPTIRMFDLPISF
jgi:Uma2 family endonuclease